MRCLAARLLVLAMSGAYAIGADQGAAPAAPAPAANPPAAGAADPGSLEATRRTASYQVGVAMSQSVHSFKLLPEEFIRGIQEGYSGKAKPLDPQAMQELMTRYQDMVNKDTAKENDSFFATNAKKPGMKALADGVQYEVLATGTGRTPAATDSVKVNYVGSFPDGTVFDASAKHGGPFTFTVGNGVIKSWSDTLINMKEGDKWRIYVPPALGYGEHGAPPQIPGNQILIFEIELVQVMPPSGNGNIPGLNR